MRNFSRDLILEIEESVAHFIFSSEWNGNKSELTYKAGDLSRKIAKKFENETDCGELFGILLDQLKETAEEREDAEHIFELEFEQREQERLLCASRYEFC